MAKWDYLEKTSMPEVVKNVFAKDKGESEKRAAKPQKAVEEVTIRKVDNGFTAQIRYKDTKAKNDKGEEITKYEEPSTRIFKSASEATEILEECFGA